jgi:hypothetical protein
MLQELYLTPELLNGAAWDAVADAAKWAHRNVDVLVDAHWVGGDPLVLDSWEVPAWAPGQPDSGGADDCVAAVAPSGRLDDRACDQPLSVVCEDTCVRRVDLDFDSYTACGTDCDDSDAATHPGAREVCGDRRDQDCDGVADEGCR